MAAVIYPGLSLLSILFYLLRLTVPQGSQVLFSCNPNPVGRILIPTIPNNFFNLTNIVRNQRLRPNFTSAMAQRSFIYMFPEDEQCYGTSRSLQVCYITNTLGIVKDFLRIALLEESWEVDQESKVTATSSKQTCMQTNQRGETNWTCCNTFTDFELHIDEDHIGFVVEVISRTTRPIRFRRNDSTYSQDHYEWRSINLEEYDLEEGEPGQLLLLRLSIVLSPPDEDEHTEVKEKNMKSTTHSSLEYSTTTTTTTDQILPSNSLPHKTPALTIGIVCAVIFLILILIIVVLALCLFRHYLKRRNKPSMDNAIVVGNIQEGTEAEYADIGPEVSKTLKTQIGDEGYCYAESGANPEPSPYEMPITSTTVNGYEQPVPSNPMDGYEHDDEIYMAPSSNEDSLYAQLEKMKTLSLCRENLKLGESLGSGQFGEVYRGVFLHSDSKFPVAVKTLKEQATEEDRVKFLQEAAIMGQFKHPNIVTMYGVVKDSGPILLVLELLIKGDLRQYLLQARSKEKRAMLDDHTLLSFCRQTACGMAYLSTKAFVHRDLAARNILVSDDEICKIADFGMSRDLTYESYYVSHGGMIPVKWTAPEALHYKKYSTASDVWSFGILMYEIWSLGHKPFENLENNKVMIAIDKGYRMPPPPGCPKRMYSLMMDCWNLDAARRPSFMELNSRQLSLPDSKLLQWEDRDKSIHPEADKLGANLQFASDLYMNLQKRYIDAPQ